MLILGIDPGIARVGWGFVHVDRSTHTAQEYGCFETKAGLPPEIRIQQIHQFLTEIIQKEKPTIIALEQVFFAANTTTALSVSQARGAIMLTASQANVPIASYTPLQVKQTITGYGRADKNQVQQMIKTLLKLPTIPKPDDTADALAIALTHAYSFKMANYSLASKTGSNVKYPRR